MPIPNEWCINNIPIFFFSERKAGLFILFSNDTNDYSGNNIEVLNQNVSIFGNGLLVGYFNSKRRLLVDRCSNVDQYTDLMIRMKKWQ